MKNEFEQKKQKYIMYIEDKNAKVYEESKLYTNDIINVITQFDAMINKISNLAANIGRTYEENHDNTNKRLKELSSKINSDLEEITKLTSESIKEKSLIVFNEYQKNYKVLNQNTKVLIKNIEDCFELYESYKIKKSNLENSISISVIEQKEINSQISNLKRSISNLEVKLKQNINNLGNNNVKLLAILENGLKKEAV